MAVVRGLLDALAIRSGESVLEVGCRRVIMRELARRTAGAHRLIGRDMSTYLLREARALARRAGLLDYIDFAEGRAEALPLPDGAVDVALSSTVFEEGGADQMLAQIVRVGRPGERIGIVVRAVDMLFSHGSPHRRMASSADGRLSDRNERIKSTTRPSPQSHDLAKALPD